MLRSTTLAAVITLIACLLPTPTFAQGRSDHDWDDKREREGKKESVQVGPRPYYLIDKMQESTLKHKLESCSNGPFYKTDFSIGHRGGGTLQFPEHTKESHEAGSRMGAGLLECDVTFTNDGQLVCRHDQCDLHTTTNILVTPLASKCSQAFSPAEFDASGIRTKPATALCCTSDISVAEYRTLKGKMDAFNANPRTPQEFQGGTANWRTDLYSTGATLLTHQESIELIKKLGGKYTPELKGPNRSAKLQVETVFGSLNNYPQAMIDDYKAAAVPPRRVFPQSFSKDILYWIQNEPAFGRQAAFLDDANVPADVPSAAELRTYAAQGIKIWAPPMWVLVTRDASGKIVPSQAAKDAKAAGLAIITWTLERSGRILEEVLPTRGTAAPSFY